MDLPKEGDRFHPRTFGGESDVVEVIRVSDLEGEPAAVIYRHLNAPIKEQRMWIPEFLHTFRRVST